MTTLNATAVPLEEGGRDNKWVRFWLRRAGRLVVSLWVLATTAFLMIHLVPGDPVRAALGPSAAPELVSAKRASLGLDDPLFTQYAQYLRGVLSGDLGESIGTQLSVAQTIQDRLPATAALAILAFVVAVLIAVPVGVGTAARTQRGRGRRTELVFASTSVVIATIPSFLLAVGGVYVFSMQLHWTPVAGRAGVTSYVLPVLALSVGPAAILARIVRVEMLSVLETDYIRTARAKRLRTPRIQLVHALPNAVTASLTVGGLLLGSMVAGTVMVESVFGWPGLGTIIVQSILSKDYPLIQGTVLVYGVIVLVINTMVDVALALLDPRSTIGAS